MPRPGGRAPTPKALRVLKGETRPSQVPEYEPEPEPGPTPPPRHLTEHAVSVWHTYGPELTRAGLLRPRHVEAFGAWCEAVVNMRRAAEELANAPLIVEGAYGSPVANPLSREFARYVELVRKLGIEFGMTPSAVTMLGKAAAKHGPDSAADPARILTG